MGDCYCRLQHRQWGRQLCCRPSYLGWAGGKGMEQKEREAKNGGEGGAAAAAHLDEDLHRGEEGEEGEDEGALKRSGMCCSVLPRLCRTQPTSRSHRSIRRPVSREMSWLRVLLLMQPSSRFGRQGLRCARLGGACELGGHNGARLRGFRRQLFSQLSEKSPER